MNPEHPADPRQALEPSLTALLLGELPADQARFVRQAVETNPQLAKTFQRLERTTALIRQVEAPRVATPPPSSEAPKLGEARRQELLRQFKTLHPAQLGAPRPRNLSWVVPVAAVVVLTLSLAGFLLRQLSNSKSRASAERTLAQVKAPISVETIGGAVAPARRTRGAQSQLSDQLALGVTANRPGAAEASDSRKLTRELVENERLKSPPAGPGSISATLTSSAAPQASGQSSIILPAEPTQSIGQFAGTEPQANRTWNSYKPPEFAQIYSLAGGVTQNETSFGIAPNRAAGLGRGSGGAAPEAQRGIPVLGDVPLLGYQFRDAQGIPSLGTDYAGGTFGGYSTVQPQTPQPGQQLDVVTIQGLGDLPVLKDSAEEQSVAALSTSPAPGLASVQAPSGQPAALENSPALTWAEVADSKQDKVDQLREQIAVAGRSGNSIEGKKESEGRAKTLAERIQDKNGAWREDEFAAKAPATPASPLPEIQTASNPFSTFSLNVSDVSFKLAAASLAHGKLPEESGIRSEEFINAFDYRDPDPAPGQPVGLTWERAGYPFAQDRDLLRLSIKTAAAGRQAGKPLNLVLLLDNSGSMERADRVQIIHEALRVLAGQLQASDALSVVTFARTARLWVDGMPGDQAGRVAEELSGLTPQGGTNLEEAMNLAYETALRHYLAGGINRVVLLTDGAANLGATAPEILKQKVDINRKQGIALDCFGIGWEGYNDGLLELLTRTGDGRYGFLNTPAEAASEFAGQLTGALRVAASDVKVQVEFNPNRVTLYRQIGYTHHQLTKEQFHDNTVNAAAIGAAESGTALYCLQTNPQGDGPIATVRIRYRTPGTADYQEHEWVVPYAGNAVSLDQAGPAMRLAGTAAAFSEWLGGRNSAAEVSPDRLLECLNGVPAAYGADPRPQKLEWMIRQAKAISGK